MKVSGRAVGLGATRIGDIVVETVGAFASDELSAPGKEDQAEQAKIVAGNEATTASGAPRR